ncbi:MAG: hypothetical protein QOG07_1248, partial [Pseudonocardiales bacterium]|nr:hypothetical protein [Pseudonocardiales bacterium]
SLGVQGRDQVGGWAAGRFVGFGYRPQRRHRDPAPGRNHDGRTPEEQAPTRHSGGAAVVGRGMCGTSDCVIHGAASVAEPIRS